MYLCKHISASAAANIDANASVFLPVAQKKQDNMLVKTLLSCESLIINQNKLFILTTSDHLGNFPPCYQNSWQQFPAFNQRYCQPPKARHGEL